MSFLSKIDRCNQFDATQFYHFCVEGKNVGFIQKNKAELLRKWAHIFVFNQDAIFINPTINSYHERTNAIHDVVVSLQKDQIIPTWGDEYYGVSSDFHQTPLFEIQRSAAPFFGIKTYGTHLNGFIQKDDDLFVWVAKRAAHLKFLPGKLDNLAAGGLPIGISPRKNMIKEAHEETNLSKAVLRKMKSTSVVSYLLATPQGATPDTMFIYDLELATDVIPIPNKEEVESFNLISLDEVYEMVKNEETFKYNTDLVMIDFLIRFGAITPKNKDYLVITHGLRQQRMSF